jgi:hypothetical protein
VSICHPKINNGVIQNIEEVEILPCCPNSQYIIELLSISTLLDMVELCAKRFCCKRVVERAWKKFPGIGGI